MSPIGKESTKSRTHDFFRDPQKCFHFNFLKSEEKYECNNDYIIINLAQIIFLLIIQS